MVIEKMEEGMDRNHSIITEDGWERMYTLNERGLLTEPLVVFARSPNDLLREAREALEKRVEIFNTRDELIKQWNEAVRY